MVNHIATTGRHFTDAVSIPGVQYFSVSTTVRTSYHPSRKRSPFANTILKAFCAVVSSVMVTGEVDRAELFEKYDYKLWSYDDHLVLFTLATIPSVLVLAAIYATFRGIQGFRLAFSLQN